jgi:beta-mannosidase
MSQIVHTQEASLAGDWTLVDETGEYNTTISLPTDVISTLHQQNLIPDPYWGRNEFDLRWIAERKWTVSRDFSVTDVNQVLVLSQLDTIATVRVNGEVVLNADNAFREFRIKLQSVLNVGTNTLEIDFHSNIKEAARLQDEQPFFVPGLEVHVPIPNGNMLRKTQCDFGWDWNIALAPFGIYGDIKLVPDDTLRVCSVVHQQTHQLSNGNAKVTVEVTIHLDGFASTDQVISLQLGEEKKTITVEAQSSVSPVTSSFEIRNPKLWWPAGSGEQPLYSLTASLGEEVVSQRIGLRDAKLILEKDDIGTGFAFQINGKALFAKGANWIPADALAGNITPEKTRELLQSAVDANMNMLRVWGGGRYENDWFYDLCDEMGLMVWQDFMFSCNLYPSDPAYLANVTHEVIENVQRMQHHASIVLWCGDNELVGALTWFEESIKDRDKYLVSYDRLNRTIETALATADPDANWWPSSPSPGFLEFGDSWHSDASGDMHFWSVWHEGKDFEHYRDIKPRFCSEFGFQSYPSMNTIKTFAGPEDFNIGAPVFESHQKNHGGNARIAETMFRYFRFPNDFENFVYLSQVQQGLAIKTAVSYWRSLKPHCMGALYWQLNDTWPVASWASINYGGEWKLLHHMAKEFFSPVSVSVVPTETDYEFFGIVDGHHTLAVSLRVEAVSVEGSKRSLAESKISIDTDRAKLMVKVPITSLNDNEILVFYWTGEDSEEQQDHYAPKPYKQYDIQPANISTDIVDDAGTVTIKLSCDKPAFFVSLEADCVGRFSDNAFLLLPEEPKSITFKKSNVNDQVRVTVRDLHTATYHQVS